MLNVVKRKCADWCEIVNLNDINFDPDDREHRNAILTEGKRADALTGRNPCTYYGVRYHVFHRYSVLSQVPIHDATTNSL